MNREEDDDFSVIFQGCVCGEIRKPWEGSEGMVEILIFSFFC